MDGKQNPEPAPDWRRLAAACRNEDTGAFPLYEHNVHPAVVETLLGRSLMPLRDGDYEDRKEYFRACAGCLRNLGYDTVPFEGCITRLIQGGKGLRGEAPGIIRDGKDVEDYPWEEIPDRYFRLFDDSLRALAETLPPGMKAHGGVGNGVFEVVQDFLPLTELAYLQVDDPEAWEALVGRVGDLLTAIWDRFLSTYGDHFAVCRFGDDLGFRTSTLLRPDDIQRLIVPQYARIVDLVHRAGKPFLLHSCGAIFPVMEDIIAAGVDAKHSNEDNIAPFRRWVEEYGDRIGNVGGVDMNILCTEDEAGVALYVREVLDGLRGRKGIAFGSGNQITDYTPPENFLAMVRTVREYPWQSASF